jgi:hypothetical protein
MKREINIYLEAGRRWRRWASRRPGRRAVRSENQELPLGAIRSLAIRSAWCRSTRA